MKSRYLIVCLFVSAESCKTSGCHGRLPSEYSFVTEGSLQETAAVLDTVHYSEPSGIRTPDTLIKSQVLYL
jgi:hypothetical protein